MERRQQARQSYNVDEALDFLSDSADEDQRNILNDSERHQVKGKTKKII